MSSKDWSTIPIKKAYLGLFDGPHATPKPSDEGPVFLGIGNLTDDGHLDLTQVRHIAEEDFSKWTKRVTPLPGDIVFTYEATLNRYAIIPSGFRGCLGRRLALIRPDPNVVDTQFLHYYFFGKQWRNTIAENIISGATVERIPLIHFPNFPISVPKLQKQQRISSILSAYDDLIENNTRRIEILEEMARSLYREWFVNFRFPGHDKTANGLPKNWILKKLGDLVVDSRNTIHPTEIDSTTPYVGLEHIPRRSLALTEWGYARDVQSTKLTFNKGDILFGKIRPYFHKVVVAPFDGVCSTDTIVIIAKSAEWFPLILMTVFSDDFVNHATQTSNGTKMPRANWDVLLRFSIPTPPDDLLNKFNGFTNEIVNQITNLISKNCNLRETRNLLLPKLISGEIDVSKFAEENMEVSV